MIRRFFRKIFRCKNRTTDFKPWENFILSSWHGKDVVIDPYSLKRKRSAWQKFKDYICKAFE